MQHNKKIPEKIKILSGIWSNFMGSPHHIELLLKGVKNYKKTALSEERTVLNFI